MQIRENPENKMSTMVFGKRIKQFSPKIKLGRYLSWEGGSGGGGGGGVAAQPQTNFAFFIFIEMASLMKNSSFFHVHVH